MTAASRNPEPEASGANPSIAYSLKAETALRAQRLALARELMRIDETNATPEDLALAKRVMESVKGDGTDFDKALADAAVNGLYRRGVLHFGESK